MPEHDFGTVTSPELFEPVAQPLKKSERKRAEPEPREPKLVESDSAAEFVVPQELQGERVADTLIRARQQLGQDLRSIAEVLCIRYSYLDAIERGQYENLPGATYAVGFVRSYAEFLGLDGDQVVERFKSEVEGLDSQTKLHFPTPAPEGRMPGGAVFLVAALLFAGAYGVWFYLSNKGESLGDLVAPVPERLQEMVAGDTPSVAADEIAAVPPGPSSSPAAETPPQTTAETPVAEVLEPISETPSLTQADNPSAPEAAEPAVDAADPAADSPLPAAIDAAAPRVTEPAAAMTAPQNETAAVVPPREGETALPGLPQDAALAPSSTPAGVAPQAEDTPPSAAVAAPEALPAGSAGSAEASAAAAPPGNEPYAIPAAPDSNTPATAFLVNHEPKVYGEENADARIVLKANQDAWVQVRDRQGTLLLTRVLRVGDSYRVPNQGDLTLLTGNAGGLEIVVDGRALAPLGPVGAVRRNIPLDPQALTSGNAR